MVNRLVRSTRVPIAELFSPMMRSTSQCPGTARFPASAGRWLIMTAGVRNVLPGLRTRALGTRSAPAGAQASGELAPQSAATLNIEGLLDGLVRNPHGLIIGVIDPEPARDLLGAPCPGPPPVLAASVASSDPSDIRAGHARPVRPDYLAYEAVLAVLPQRVIDREPRCPRPP